VPQKVRGAKDHEDAVRCTLSTASSFVRRRGRRVSLPRSRRWLTIVEADAQTGRDSDLLRTRATQLHTR
jgi:hypothetical protein